MIIKVAKIGTGAFNDPIRPNLPPEIKGYQVVSETATTFTVEIFGVEKEAVLQNTLGQIFKIEISDIGAIKLQRIL